MVCLRAEGDVSYDPAVQAIWKAGHPVTLTPKAAAVLTCLIENAGNLVSHEQLLDHVWPETFVQPEAIKVYIFELRRAMGDTAKTPDFIETIPRRGYRLKNPPMECVPKQTNRPPDGKHLVGRHDELGMMLGCFSGASHGTSQTVFVSGDAGIGKTAMVETFAGQIQNTGVRMLKGQCVRIHGQQEPYYPLLEALGKVRLDGFSEALARYAPTWAFQLPALFTPDERERLRRDIFGATAGRMLREICELLENISQETLWIFVVEDVHWADAATIDFLAALAQRRSAARLLTICTSRPVNLLPKTHPLRLVSRELVAKALWTNIALSPLNGEGVRQIVEQELGDDFCSRELIDRVAETSGGNPLFIGSIVQRLRNAGGEVREENDESWEPSRLELSDDLQGLLLSQFSELDAEERELLEYGSVAGTAFSVCNVAALFGRPAADVEACLDRMAGTSSWLRARAERSILEGSPHEFEFKHALYRDVIYRQMGRRRRASAHRYLAGMLENLQSGSVEEHASELAWRYHECGDPEKTVYYLQLAALRAIDRCDPRSGVALLTRALALVKKFPSAERRTEAHIGVLLHLVKAQSLAGSYETPCDSREELVATASAAQRWELAAAAAINFMINKAEREPSRCLAAADWAVAVAARSTLPRQTTEAELFRTYLRLLFDKPDADQFHALLQAAIEFRAVCPPERKAHAGWLCAQVQADTADYGAAVESVRIGRAAAVGVNDNQAYEANNRYLRTHLLFAGKWREFWDECNRSSDVACRNGAQVHVDAIKLQRAHLYLECFDHDSMLEIVQNIQPVRDAFAHKLAALKAMVYVRTGRAGLALRTAEEGLKVGGGCIELRQRLKLQHARIEALLATHQFADALSALKVHQRFVHSTAERTYHALTWDLLARIHLANHDVNLACDATVAALKITHEYDLPLADWKVSATASVVYHSLGRYDDAAGYRDRGLAAIRKLAAELDGEPGLREKFQTGAIQCLSPADMVLGASTGQLLYP